MNAGKADSLTIADTGSTEQAVYFSEGVPKVCTNLKGIPSGGTVGQYLVKNSDNNFDVSWNSLDLSHYLTIANASNIYLRKTDATDTYLSKSEASSTYLTQNNASEIYDTKSNVSTNYLKKIEASSTYLNKSDATSTYEHKKKIFKDIAVPKENFVADATIPDFGYRASITLSGVTTSMIPEVFYNGSDAAGGVFASVSQSFEGGIYIYANAQPQGTTNIPVIILWKGE